MNEPLISVVIPTFRSATLLPGALDSLARQLWRGFEVIVSDGASDDGTPELARAYAGSLPALRVDSRPDSGVYDAINRGVAQARGEWVLVLGSDDRLHANDTLARVAPLLQSTTAEWVHGDVRMMAASPDGVAAGGRYAGPMPLARLLKANICQQAIFYRRRLALPHLGRLGLQPSSGLPDPARVDRPDRGRLCGHRPERTPGRPAVAGRTAGTDPPRIRRARW
jgi:glycosyltransferase involved in cell wall biosynthesis